MTHAQWHARVRKSLAMVERQPIRALASLHKLVHQLQSESKKTAGDWHIEQTLEVISIVQSHQEDHCRSAETILAVADRHEQQLSYYSRGFVAACATAALEFASAGDRKAALRAAARGIAGPAQITVNSVRPELVTGLTPLRATTCEQRRDGTTTR